MDGGLVGATPSGEGGSSRYFRFGPNEGQIGPISPEWDKSGTLSDQFLGRVASASQNVLKLNLKSHRFVPFGCQIWTSLA